MKFYSAYDILNDICCRYAVEFFGEELICGSCYKLDSECECDREDSVGVGYSNEIYSNNILSLLQQNKIQEAEDYIWKHCKFNKEQGKPDKLPKKES